VTEDVLLVHGTPDSDLTYFLETPENGACRPATPQEVAARAKTARSSLILCGHTHLPRMMQLDDGRLIVNPGSVGLQASRTTFPFPTPLRPDRHTPGTPSWSAPLHLAGGNGCRRI
jgi:Icc-related predicted phosphoesterase